jgi:hypothetical protein
MPIKHIVEQGEGISSIAFDYGFFPNTIWDDGANAEWRRLRENPNALLPGDVITIPDKREKELEGGPGAMHAYRLKNITALFQLQIFKGDTPRANEDYQLFVDGREYKGKTDGKGNLSQYVSPAALWLR